MSIGSVFKGLSAEPCVRVARRCLRWKLQWKKGRRKKHLKAQNSALHRFSSHQMLGERPNLMEFTWNFGFVVGKPFRLKPFRLAAVFLLQNLPLRCCAYARARVGRWSKGELGNWMGLMDLMSKFGLLHVRNSDSFQEPIAAAPIPVAPADPVPAVTPVPAPAPAAAPAPVAARAPVAVAPPADDASAVPDRIVWRA